MSRELKKLKKELLEMVKPKDADILLEIFREENFFNIMLDENLNERQKLLKEYFGYHLTKDHKNKRRMLDIILKGANVWAIYL